MSKQTKTVPARAATNPATKVPPDSAAAPRGRRPARVPIDPPTSKRKPGALKQAPGTKKAEPPAPSTPRQRPVEAPSKPLRKGREAGPKRPSALDAAARVLAGLKGAEARDGIAAPDLIERMKKAKLWLSPGGKTPAATLYAAMIREINAKGKASRFVRPSPGRFRSATSGGGGGGGGKGKAS